MIQRLLSPFSTGLFALMLVAGSAALAEQPFRGIYHAPPGDGVILRSDGGIPARPHYSGERTAQGRYWSTQTGVVTSPYLSHRVTNTYGYGTGYGYGFGGVYIEVDERRGHVGRRVGRHHGSHHGRVHGRRGHGSASARSHGRYVGQVGNVGSVGRVGRRVGHVGHRGVTARRGVSRHGAIVQRGVRVHRGGTRSYGHR